MKILWRKWIMLLFAGFLSTSLLPASLFAEKKSEISERKPLIVLKYSLLYITAHLTDNPPYPITNKTGYRNPSFVLYDDGLVILKKKGDLINLYSVTLTQREMQEFLGGFNFSDEFMHLEDSTFTSNRFHPPSNTLSYFKNGKLERVVGVFGELDSNKKDRSKTPRAFLKVYDRIKSFKHNNLKSWQPEQFVIWATPMDETDPNPWPKNWPDMKHPSTKKDPDFEKYYLMYINGKYLEDFERLYSSIENPSFLINEKAWYISPKRHCLPAEELWLNPDPYPQIKASAVGNFYTKSLKIDTDDEPLTNRKKGNTLVYQVVKGKDVLLDTYDWYEYNIYLNQRDLVRVGTWGKGENPNENDLAIGFYREGKMLKEYSTIEIVDLAYKNKKNVEIMNSHYQVIQYSMGFQSINSSDYSFDVKTHEGTTLSFDPTTGDLIKKVDGAN